MVKSKVCVGQFLLPKFLGIQGAIKGNMDDLGWGAPSQIPSEEHLSGGTFFLLSSRNLLVPDNWLFSCVFVLSLFFLTLYELTLWD